MEYFMQVITKFIIESCVKQAIEKIVDFDEMWVETLSHSMVLKMRVLKLFAGITNESMRTILDLAKVFQGVIWMS